MTLLAHIADRALNRPLLTTPEKAQVILSVLANRIGIEEPAADKITFSNTPAADRFEGDRFEAQPGGGFKVHPYKVTKSGVAIISIVGSLVNRGAWVGASSGLVSYEGVKHQLKHAAENPAVKSIILDIQSPGGEAVGAFETAALVRTVAAQKKVVAVVNGMAASAAYAIASGATEIVTTETGVSGSIGVVLLHADFSRKLANDGITPTLIFAGDHKVDGNPFEPLPDTVRADLQAEVTAFYDQFLATVAKGRGKRLTAAQARKTGARTFIGAEAVEMGLADRVGSFESVLEDLSRAPKGGRITVQKRRTGMDNIDGGPAAETNAGISQADHDAAVATAKTDGEKAGADAERARLASILGAEGVKGHAKRMEAAQELAAKSPAMSADDVVAFVVTNVSAETEQQPSEPDASLDNRGADSDPIGAAAGADSGKKESKGGLSGLVDARIENMKRA